MAVPNYQEFMLPLLRLAEDGEARRARDAYDYMADYFDLSEEDRNEMQPSGNQKLLNNRVAWAITYLAQAGLLERPKRGYFQITEAGRKLLSQMPSSVDTSMLEEYEAFQDFKNRTGTRKKASSYTPKPEEWHPISQSSISGTPDDDLVRAWKTLRVNLQSELLTEVKNSSPQFFEFLVVDLLVAMGYGGNRADAGRRIGTTGDEGVDGVINEDPLGLDVIYLQAKRWENVVGRPEVQKFAGALQGQRAKKGVFITTSSFSRGAIEYAENLDARIILIDGERLARLMADHDVGVSRSGTYTIKRVDSDYFEDL